MLTPFFQFSANAKPDVPEHRVAVPAVRFVLGVLARDGTDCKEIGDREPGNYARYSYDENSNGRVDFKLEVHRDGTIFRSEVGGTVIDEGIIDLDTLIVANVDQRLKHHREIDRVLHIIGDQTFVMRNGHVPETMEEYAHPSVVTLFLERHIDRRNAKVIRPPAL